MIFGVKKIRVEGSKELMYRLRLIGKLKFCILQIRKIILMWMIIVVQSDESLGESQVRSKPAGQEK